MQRKMPLPQPSSRAAKRGVPSISPLILPPLQPVPHHLKLTVELVPQTCWFSHVRDHVSTEQVEPLTSKQTYRQAHDICASCGGRVIQQWPVECHAVWHDDDHNARANPGAVDGLMSGLSRSETHWLGLKCTGHLAEAQAHLSHGERMDRRGDGSVSDPRLDSLGKPPPAGLDARSVVAGTVWPCGAVQTLRRATESAEQASVTEPT